MRATEKEVELNSPFLDLTFDSYASERKLLLIVAGWILLWAAVGIGLLYVYVAVLPSYLGFETTALLGIGIAALSASAKE